MGLVWFGGGGQMPLLTSLGSSTSLPGLSLPPETRFWLETFRLGFSMGNHVALLLLPLFSTRWRTPVLLETSETHSQVLSKLDQKLELPTCSPWWNFIFLLPGLSLAACLQAGAEGGCARVRGTTGAHPTSPHHAVQSHHCLCLFHGHLQILICSHKTPI